MLHMGDRANQLGPAEKSPPTVLVVDDDVLIRMSVCDFLRDCGFKVIEAGNAAEAIAVLNAIPDIDVLFSDIQMPGDKTGFDLAHWTRLNYPATKIILTSGVAKMADAAHDLCQNGGPTFLAKPYYLPDLEERIQALLKLSKD